MVLRNQSIIRMKTSLASELERLRNLIELVKNEGLTDFNSGLYDIQSVIENQCISIAELAQSEKLTQFEIQLIKRLILEAQFLFE